MKVRKMHSPRHRELLSKFQLPGQRLVTAGVCDMEIIQQPPALAHHFQQTPSGTVILEVFLKVLGQMVDALRQQGNLNIGRPGVALVNPEFFNHFRFRFHTVDHFTIGLLPRGQSRFGAGRCKALLRDHRPHGKRGKSAAAAQHRGSCLAPTLAWLA